MRPARGPGSLAEAIAMKIEMIGTMMMTAGETTTLGRETGEGES
jgi:hypothetical protein